MLKDEEAFAREFDKKVRADERVLEAEAWSRRMYDIKLLRQTLPPDDAYDFIYDAVMFYQISFNIIDYFVNKCPDTDFNELVPEQMRPLFESFTNQLIELPTKIAQKREEIGGPFNEELNEKF